LFVCGKKKNRIFKKSHTYTCKKKVFEEAIRICLSNNSAAAEPAAAATPAATAEPAAAGKGKGKKVTSTTTTFRSSNALVSINQSLSSTFSFTCRARRIKKAVVAR
jgi:hypothetical protein